MTDLRHDVIEAARKIPQALFDPPTFQQALLDLLDAVHTLEVANGNN